MKKTLMLAVTALSMGACTNQTDVILPETPQEVSLTAVTQKATRGALDGSRLDAATEMYVFATEKTDEQYEAWFENAVFTNKDNNNQNPWTGGYKYDSYFKNFEFWAYTTDIAPDQVKPTAKLTLDNTNKHIASLELDYTTNKLKGETDVLVSDIAQVAKNGDGGYGNFSLTFRHTLCWIMINFTGSADDIMVNNPCIQSAQITGKLTSTPVYSGSAISSFNDVWSDISTDDVSFPSYNVTGGLEYNTAAGTTAKGLLVIPGNQTKITFDYKIKAGASYPTEWSTYTITPTSGAQWEAGKKYIYNVSVSTQEVSIIASVEPWTQTSDTSVILK